MEISTIQKSLKKFGLNFNNKIVRAIHEMHKNESDSDNSNNDFDFKVYINGHEDLIQSEVYVNPDNETTSIINTYGKIASTYFRDVTSLILNMFNNKMCICINKNDVTDYDNFIVKVYDYDTLGNDNDDYICMTDINVEIDDETGDKKLVVGMFRMNLPINEIYAKAEEYLMTWLLSASETIESKDLIKYL